MTLAWASADEACRAMLEGGAVALAWNRFSAETRAVVRAEYLASLEPFRRGERYDVPAEVDVRDRPQAGVSGRASRNVPFRPWSRLSVESRRQAAGSENGRTRRQVMKTLKQFTMMVAVAVAGLAFASTVRARRPRPRRPPRRTSRRRSGSSRSSSCKPPRVGPAGRLGGDEDAAAEPDHGAAGPHQGADRPGRVGADSLQVLHRRPHRVRQAERRLRRRDRRGGRDGGHHPPLEHVPERHPDRRGEVPRRDRQASSRTSRRRARRRRRAHARRRGGRRQRLKESRRSSATCPSSSASSRPRPGPAPGSVPRRAASPGDGAVRQGTRSWSAWRSRRRCRASSASSPTPSSPS